MPASVRPAQYEVNERPHSKDEFERLNLEYRVCVEPVPKRDDPNTCECNHKIDVGQIARKKSNTTTAGLNQNEWSIENNTKTRPHPEHGALFDDALYVRLDIKTNIGTVKTLLREYWKIPKPKLIMSIIGGAKHFKLTDRLESNFVNWIYNVAVKSNVWIITGGFNVGITQLVGRAIKMVKFKKREEEEEKQTIAIGICKWGSIKDRKEILGIKTAKSTAQKKSEKNPTFHLYSDDDDNDNDDDNNNVTKTKERKKGERHLEINHTHYLMVDDGKCRHFDTGDFRTRLCKKMSKMDDINLLQTPVVTIVVEGGSDTISNIYYDLKQHIPVVIVDGSGRVADFINRWLLYTKEFVDDREKCKREFGINEFKQKATGSKKDTSVKSDEGTDVYVELDVDREDTELRNMFEKHLKFLQQDLETVLHRDDQQDTNHQKTGSEHKNRNEKFKKTVDQVLYCLQPSIRQYITIFDLNSEGDLAETIFQGICKPYEKSSKKKKSKQNNSSKKTPVDPSKLDSGEIQMKLLDLAMDWDCIDVAKEFVLKNSLNSIPDQKQAFEKALEKNLPTFVYEFIKLGIDLTEVFLPVEPTDEILPIDKFFTKADRYKEFIKICYKDKIIKKAESQLRSFVEDDTDLPKNQIDSSEALNTVLRTLIGDYMHSLYFDSFDEEHKYQILWGLKRNIKKDADNPEVESIFPNEEKQEVVYNYIMRDLFIWSVLMNYTDMAKVLLSHMTYRICPALIATKIFKKYHHKAPHGELKDSYKESAEYFEQYAINCLDRCYNDDPDKACEIILQQNQLYGFVTCLQVAADAKDKSFIARPCCIEAMNNIWFDKLDPEQKRKRDMIALIVGFLTLGLVAPLIVKYRKPESAETGESLEPTLRRCGIDYSDSYPLEHPIHDNLPASVNRYWHKLLNFHTSPLMKFCYHLVTYVFFLLLFSYVLLFDFQPPTDQIPSIHWTEILTIMLVSFMLIEETHYFWSQDRLTFTGKCKKYCFDLFRIMTLLAIVLFYIGLILRFRSAADEVDFTAARVVMALDIELWWLCSLQFIIVIPFLGPNLVAIAQMLKDLLFFIYIIAIVMIGYGVASRSMVYYPIANNFTTETNGTIDVDFDGRDVFRQILSPVYYLLYGEFGNETTNLDTDPNAGWSISTEVLLAFHMLFVNILLTNLLIAIFSKRYDQVYHETQKIWHSQQYLFTREYYIRSPCFPPISFFFDIYYLIRMFVFFIIQQSPWKLGDYRAKHFQMMSKKEIYFKEWHEFEGASTYNYAHAVVKKSKAADPSKSSSESDPDVAAKKNSITDKQDHSNSTRINLKKLQDHILTLNACMEEINATVNLIKDKPPDETGESSA